METEPIRVLILEDSELDAELAVRALKSEGFAVDWARVETPEDFGARLSEPWDMVLADYAMPRFSAPAALKAMNAQGSTVPLIVVSGSISDEAAVECLKQGAADYLLKDRIGRLGNAVRTALRERRLRVERERALAALERSELTLRTIFRAAPVGIGEVRPGRILGWVNEGLANLVGYTPEELQGKSVRILYATDAEFDRVGRERQAQLGRGIVEAVQTKFRNRSGMPIDVLLRWAAIDPQRPDEGTIFTALDITAQVQANEELRQSEETFRQLFESMAEGVIYQSADGRILSANSAAELILGIPVRMLVGRNSFDPTMRAIFPDGTRCPTESQPPTVALRSRQPVTNAFLGFWNPREEDYRWVIMNSVPLFRKGERNPYKVFTTFTDVTDRKRAEDERLLLVSAIDQAAEAIIIIDTKGIVEYANPAVHALLGYSVAEALGRDIRTLGTGEQDPTKVGEMWATVQRGQTWQGVWTSRRKDGSLFRERAIISPVRDSSGNLVAATSSRRDVTREEELDTQLERSQRMEAIGRLAGGIAHDFNNILQAVEGYAELAMEEGTSPETLREHLQEVLQAAERGSALIRQLLVFERREAGELGPLDLGALVRDLSAMIGRLIGEDITFELDLPNNLWTVVGDPGQLEQALTNLCVNARAAMPKGGRLIIEARNVTLDGEYLATHPWAHEGDYVALTVTDTGTGIPPEAMEHIFEPFYSMRESGAGAGLGLATVYGIVRRHDGLIHVYSEPGEGTTFRLYLPARTTASSTVARLADAEAARGGTETILLAEDDEQARKLASIILRNAGYNTLLAENGDQALELYRAHRDEIDIAVLDVIMPGKTGRVVADTMRADGSRFPILFMSGYSFHRLEQADRDGEPFELIEKPFSPRDLLRRIRHLLGQSTGTAE
ncbi:MAG: PAS domain S-box protein [Candidatus Sumerlaeia bacterium]|nr:PAS domain S-box protein [Candidatus Sumerlaeia bacterium]